MRILILLAILAPVAGLFIEKMDAEDARSNESHVESGSLRGQVVLHPDDVPAFPAPPDGFDVRRNNIPRGHFDLIEYDSKIVGTKRLMNVYTPPPGYSKDRQVSRALPAARHRRK